MAMRMAAHELGERADAIWKRIANDGSILGAAGLAADIKWARELIDTIERAAAGHPPLCSKHGSYACEAGCTLDSGGVDHG